MKKIGFVLAFLPLALFAAPNGSGEYDIIPRTINFLIFVAILFYFLARPAKEFYNNRITKIATRLEEIQNKVLESKNKKLETIKKLEDAKKEAIVAINTAKKEAELLAVKLKNDTKNDIALLEKHFEEQKVYEQRKMQKEVIAKILNQMFSECKLKQDEILDIMLKKVS
ncbi:F0F1 ATP synthase subunit B [Campylobacter sp. MIT 97-5078]|uniref:F0F1 ATP synthase subunit B n=1 Tax=Campylobacter sp. MIT 97-5078 TaxID=1548153 RepID=UPI0005140A2E|nr:F0F1 ATP synthase subunit B [Campylobacter sp. MIT 97-5078]KGI56523.1 ATP synthase F0F1 subunit B [Campylobacter sp. MIT 97-5078]TQR27026.1 F0F1 ATP synthase subunit B [Campylobacter sp. MIT 97-5078]